MKPPLFWIVDENGVLWSAVPTETKEDAEEIVRTWNEENGTSLRVVDECGVTDWNGFIAPGGEE